MTQPLTDKQPLLWSDIILWLTIFAAIGIFVYFQFKQQQRQTITLAFRDANEMTIGANVRMMGTDIGYVNGIELKNDHVDVQLKTERGMVSIPPGSRATISFTGLGGAKSIEIDPPRKFDLLAYRNLENRAHVSSNGVIVEEPIRQKDNFKYMIDIAESLKDGAKNFYNAFGEGTPEQASKNIKHTIQKSSQFTATIKQTNTEIINSIAVYKNVRPRFFGLVEDINRTFESMAEILDSQIIGPTAYDLLYTTSVSADHLSQNIEHFLDGKQFENIQNKTLRIRQSLEYINTLLPHIQQIAINTGKTSTNALSQMEQKSAQWKQQFNQSELKAIYSQIITICQQVNKYINPYTGN